MLDQFVAMLLLNGYRMWLNAILWVLNKNPTRCATLTPIQQSKNMQTQNHGNPKKHTKDFKVEVSLSEMANGRDRLLLSTKNNKFRRHRASDVS